MSKIKTYLTASCLIAIAVIFGAFVRYTPLEKGLADGQVVQYSPATNTGVLCGSASSTLLLATSTGSRTWIRITNISSNPVYLGLGVPATNYNGIYLAASSSFDFGQDNVVFAGSIYCTGMGAAASTTVVTIP